MGSRNNRTNLMWQALARLRHPTVQFVPRSTMPSSPVDAVVEKDGAREVVGTWEPGVGGRVRMSDDAAARVLDPATMTESRLKNAARRLQDADPELKWSHALEGAAIRYGFKTYNSALFYLRDKEHA